MIPLQFTRVFIKIEFSRLKPAGAVSVDSTLYVDELPQYRGISHDSAHSDSCSLSAEDVMLMQEHPTGFFECLFKTLRKKRAQVNEHRYDEIKL